VTHLAAARYIGRFAPSPTGPLHLGSLVTAVASFLHARLHHGQWLIRVEDIDHTRSLSKVAEQHIRDLSLLGMHSDAAVVRQSQRQTYYRQALSQLERLGVLYGCQCSRQERANQEGRGGCCLCFGKNLSLANHALRIHLGAPAVQEQLTACQTFYDEKMGRFTQDLSTQVGDFVLRRADGAISYQLAVVVDDAQQQITHVVRGADLLDNTPRQILLQRLLQLPTPSYAHIALVLAADGKKLSKQNGASALQVNTPQQRLTCLLEAAAHLHLNLPQNGSINTLDQFWHAATLAAALTTQ
jgi:glutamyl-Q tRNA(Asp) synthetase